MLYCSSHTVVIKKSVSSGSPGRPSLMQNGHFTLRTPLPQQLQLIMPSGVIVMLKGPSSSLISQAYIRCVRDPILQTLYCILQEEDMNTLEKYRNLQNFYPFNPGVISPLCAHTFYACQISVHDTRYEIAMVHFHGRFASMNG